MTEADYALHALPPALLSYTLAAAMLGAVTVRGTARESRRSIGLMLLVVAALMEAYWAYSVPVRIPSRQKHQGGSPDDIIMVCPHFPKPKRTLTHKLAFSLSHTHNSHHTVA